MAIVFDANGNLVDTENRITFSNEGSDVLPPNPFTSPGTADDAYANLIGLPANQDMGYLLGVPETSNAGYLKGVPQTADDLGYLLGVPQTTDDQGYLLGVPDTSDTGFPFAPQNRLQGLDLNRFKGVGSLGIANEDDQEQELLSGQKEKSGGITDLFKALLGFAIPGANFFLNQGQRGMDGIRSLNQRLRNTNFGQSRTGAEYAMRRREQKQADRAQEAMPGVYRSAREQGFTNDRGGFSTSRADRAGTSLGSGQFSSKRSTGRQGY